MALTGLQIFKLMPKTNCKECGHPTCLAFSMALASSKITLDACPYVTDEAKEALGAAAAPPVCKVAMGKDEKLREMGDETVLFRHDKQFFHPTCLAITLDDDLEGAAFKDRLNEINDLVFERVGVTVSADAIALVDKTNNPDNYAEKAKIVASEGKFAPILMSESPEVLKKAAAEIKDARPLLCGITESNWEAVAQIAKENDCPVVVSAPNLDQLAALSEKVSGVTKNIILQPTAEESVQKLAELTQIRRQAIRKKVRNLGYPSLVSVAGLDKRTQVADASMYIAKYGSIVVLDTCEKAHILPLCALRQNLFSDPQKPAQVEPNVYAIGDATEDSPVYCTTNFSLTYYTVEGEISSTKIPSWIVAVPTDGTSVLTAWAAGKFTAEKIAEFIEEIELTQKVNHKNLIIPGYVASMKMPIEEKTGWNVTIGPNEASALPAFAKANQS